METHPFRARCYREVLRQEFERRAARNDRYSLRAFARDLGIQAPRLCALLKGRDGLSRTSAAKIARRLGFSASDTTAFCLLVDSKHARSPAAREKARRSCQTANLTRRSATLDLERFVSIRDWHHLALLELLDADRERATDPASLGMRLGLSAAVVRAALSRLRRLGLAKQRNGHWSAVDDDSMTPTDIPSGAIREYQDQLIQKARQALQLQNVAQREVSSVVLAFDPTQLGEVKALIAEFRTRLSQLARKGKRQEVYAFTTQFFPLTRMEMEP